MRTTSYCQCGRQLVPVSGRHSRRWSPPAVLKSQASRGTALIVHSTDYSATATDEGVLLLPPKQQLQEEDLVNVFNYERDLQGKQLLQAAVVLQPAYNTFVPGLMKTYMVGKVIGAGSFGVVREAVQRGTGIRYAVKSVPKTPKRGVPTPRYLLKLRQEVDAMQQLGASLDAVYLADVFEDDTDVHMVMEICEGPSLTDSVSAGQLINEEDIATVMSSILRFIAQCHGKGLVYRDVKPDNFIFVRDDFRSPLKATDFGLSIRHRTGESPLTSRSGTPAYMAPEVIMQSYSSKSDIWSVGMVAFQLLTGRFPFCENIRTCTLQDVWKAILTESGRMDRHIDCLECSVGARDFLRALLQRDPSKRVSATQALQLPWVRYVQEKSEVHMLDGSVVQRLQRFATYGSLKQQVLRIITEELAAHERAKAPLEKVQAIFEQMDTDRDGNIDAKELRKALKAFGYSLEDAEVDQLMSRMDLNMDGRVDFAELAASLLDWQQFQAVEQEWDSWVERVFDKLDSDNNGFVDLAEIMAYVPVFAPGYSSNAPDEEGVAQRSMDAGKSLLRQMDTDGDGKISRDEFRSILTDAPELDSLSNYDMRLMLSQTIDCDTIVKLEEAT